MATNLIHVKSEDAPKAIGPYSQAIVANGFVFISGQLPINPSTGKIDSEDIHIQVEQVLRNIGAILTTAGASFHSIVKAEIYLKDLNDFAIVNEIYASKFTSAIKPARQTMQVARLPLDALVEISCIATVLTNSAEKS